MGPFSRAPKKNVTNGHYTRVRDAWDAYKLKKKEKPSYGKLRTVAEMKRIMADELYKITEMRALYASVTNQIASKARKREAQAVLRWYRQYEADWKALDARIMRVKTATFPSSFWMFPFRGGNSNAFALAVGRYFNAVNKINNPGTGNWILLRNINNYKRRTSLPERVNSSSSSMYLSAPSMSNVPLRERFALNRTSAASAASVSKPDAKRTNANEKNRRIKYLTNVINMEQMFQERAQKQLQKQNKEIELLKRQLMECTRNLKKSQ